MDPEKSSEKQEGEKVTLSIQDDSAHDAAYFCGSYDGYRKALFDVASITLILMGVAFIIEYNRR